MKQKLFVISIIIGLTISCSTDTGTQTGFLKQNKNIVQNHYSQFFLIEQHKDYKKLTVYDPWQKAENISFDYILSRQPKKLPKKLADKTVIKVPVENVVCLSTTHIAYLDKLNELKSVKAASGISYSHNNYVRQQAALGEISETGYEQNINFELLVSLQPDVVFAYGIETDNYSYLNKLRELGCTVVFVADYLENTALGRAEWLRFIAEFYDKSDMANRLFKQIDSSYNAEQHKISALKLQKPTVMMNLPWKDVWYVPGGMSYFAELIKDAGGNYIWKDNTNSESITLSFEVVVNNTKNADIWLHPGSANNISDIVSDYPQLAKIKAVRDKRIFNNTKRQNQNGGNDFYESAIVQPDVLLKDLIQIFHPELTNDWDLYYYKKLKAD